MTRGTLAIILNDDRMLRSIVFNGEMYLDGYGVDAIKCLEKVDVEDDFDDAIRQFDLEHHKYQDEEMTWVIKGAKPYLDMSKDYIVHWFSDYVFIKNVSTEIVTITDKNKNVIKVAQDEIAVFNFGRYIDTTNITTELYESTVKDFGNKLDEEDILAIVANGRESCGIYDDTYDVGKEWACNVYGIDSGLNNDRYINFDKIGEDVIEDKDAWLQLPSGKYAHLS